jgi:hypothetical protein
VEGFPLSPRSTSVRPSFRNDMTWVSRCGCKRYSPRVASRTSSDGTPRATRAQSIVDLGTSSADMQGIEYFSTASPSRKPSRLTISHLFFFNRPTAEAAAYAMPIDRGSDSVEQVHQKKRSPTSQPSNSTRIEQAHVGTTENFVLLKRHFHH